jgi:hypothetical protein
MARTVRSRFWWTVLVLILVLAAMPGSRGVATALEVGETAPDFSLPGTTGETISLSQFRGKKLVLVEFYVDDFIPT